MSKGWTEMPDGSRVYTDFAWHFGARATLERVLRRIQRGANPYTPDETVEEAIERYLRNTNDIIGDRQYGGSRSDWYEEDA